MGHSQCGAVTATLNALRNSGKPASPNISDIVSRIEPGVREVVAAARGDSADLLAAAVRANVRASVAQVRHGSRILQEFLARGDLWVVGAEYSLESGQVTFLDEDKPADRAAEPPPPRSEALRRPREPDGIEGGQRRGSRGVL